MIRISRRAEQERNEHVKNNKKYMKLIAYPAVFLFTWLFPTINRVYQVTTGDSLYWMILLHALFSDMQGLLNSIVYIITPIDGRSIRKRMKHIFGWKNKSFTREVDDEVPYYSLQGPANPDKKTVDK